MPLYEWDERFVLGIKEIDQQHRHLMELVNRIYDEFRGGAPLPALQSLLVVLFNNAKYHFQCEEHWMEESGYPQLAEHRAEHDKFSTRVAEIDGLLEQGQDNSLDLMLFLNNWIRHHLLETDARFTDYVISANKAAGATTVFELPLHLVVKRYLSSGSS